MRDSFKKYPPVEPKLDLLTDKSIKRCSRLLLDFIETTVHPSQLILAILLSRRIPASDSISSAISLKWISMVPIDAEYIELAMQSSKSYPFTQNALETTLGSLKGHKEQCDGEFDIKDTCSIPHHYLVSLVISKLAVNCHELVDSVIQQSIEVINEYTVKTIKALKSSLDSDRLKSLISGLREAVKQNERSIDSWCSVLKCLIELTPFIATFHVADDILRIFGFLLKRITIPYRIHSNLLFVSV